MYWIRRLCESCTVLWGVSYSIGERVLSSLVENDEKFCKVNRLYFFLVACLVVFVLREDILVWFLWLNFSRGMVTLFLLQKASISSLLGLWPRVRRASPKALAGMRPSPLSGVVQRRNAFKLRDNRKSVLFMQTWQNFASFCHNFEVALPIE